MEAEPAMFELKNLKYYILSLLCWSSYAATKIMQNLFFEVKSHVRFCVHLLHKVMFRTCENIQPVASALVTMFLPSRERKEAVAARCGALSSNIKDQGHYWVCLGQVEAFDEMAQI
jgi:1,2-phenylacetyl-CoA epoxidase catalytic subunit